jgi:hypothetical protein
MRAPVQIRAAVLVAALAATAIAIATAAAAASAATIGGFGVRPATFNPDNLATRAYFIIHARGGTVRHEDAIVTNNNDVPLTLEVNAVDGLTGVTSGVVYANRGTASTGAGAWLTPAAGQITVAPDQSVDVGFVVRVPRYAAAGDHLGGLAFESLHPSKSGGAFSVSVVVRTVVGVEIEVPGHATRHLRIYSVALAPLPGTDVPSAVVTLEDDGHKLCHPQLRVSITGQSGSSSVTEKLGTMLPGDKIAYPFRWPGALSEGTYGVAATASDCGPQTTLDSDATYALTRPATAAASSSQTIGATTPLSSGWPWWIYVVLALGGGMLGGAAFSRFSRHRRAS